MSPGHEDPYDEIEIFVSYAHEDAELASGLIERLGALEDRGLAVAWHDRRIGPGEEWRPLIDASLDSADIILALVSPAFFESDFCSGIELPRALERHRSEQARVIPVLLEESGWLKTELRHLQAIPDGAQPIVEWSSRDEAWAHVVGKIGDAADLLRKRGLRRRPRRPGAQVWRVPPARNLQFTGREAELSRLHRMVGGLDAGDSVIVLAGLGGIGKTQLVLEHVYQHRDHYRIVWWIRAQTEESLLTDYASLAEALELVEKGSTDALAAARQARDWLADNPRWLLVFDNAADEDSLAEHIPPGGGGHVIITSRDPNWSQTGVVLELDPLEREDAVALLERLSGQHDPTAAAALATELGFLPLALAQAGGYLESTGRSIAAYLGLFRDRQRTLLERLKPVRDYPHTLLTTWDLSFEQARRESPLSENLLAVLAFLDPDDIPVDLLFGAAEAVPSELPAELSDPFQLDDQLGILRRVSLVSMHEGNASVHRLVQTVMRDRFSSADRRQWAGIALALVRAAFPLNAADYRSWPLSERLLPHVFAVLSWAGSLDLDPGARISLLRGSGVYLRRLARLDAARTSFEQALGVLDALPADPATRRELLRELGGVLQEQGLWEASIEKLEQALASARSDPGCHPLELAHVRNDLGSALEHAGELEAARTQYEEALGILERESEPDDARIAIAHNNLGTLALRADKPISAAQHFERALKITLQTTEGPDPDKARQFANLGSALFLLGEDQGAVSCLEHADTIFGATLPEEHPEVQQLRAMLRAARARSRPEESEERRGEMSHSIPSSDELAEAEEILGQLERDGILAFIFDGSKLVLDGDWSEVPEATLERAKQCVPSLIQLLRATFAQRFEEAEPDTSPAEGARIMMGVNVCVSMNLSDQELEARVRRAMSVTGQGRQPAVVAYPAASLDDRRAALERWLPHLPELPI